MNLPEEQLKAVTRNQPYSLLFATISGAHLYGFPSPDSDFDIRGVHILPLNNVIGLDGQEETLQTDRVIDGLHIDLVTHDIKFYFTLMLKRNGNLLDQIYSPLVVQTTPAHEELKALGIQVVTRYHAHHYLGLANSQWKLFNKETPPRIKPLLYVYRALLSGLHLMKTGKVISDLVRLNEIYKLPYVPDLVKRKVETAEKATLSLEESGFHQGEYERLVSVLEEARDRSNLPEEVSRETRDHLNDLLIRLRMTHQ